MILSISIYLVPAVVIAVVAWSARCALGWHPADQRLMRSGRRQKVRNDDGNVIAIESVTEWQCGRCLRVVETTVDRPSLAVHKRLREQVGEARERSKVINFEVVRKDGAA